MRTPCHSEPHSRCSRSFLRPHSVSCSGADITFHANRRTQSASQSKPVVR
jgi:hypothetical protein